MKRRFKAKTKRDKCKFKRCTYRKTHPEEKPRYCHNHFYLITVAPEEVQNTIGFRLKKLIFVTKP